MGTPAASCCAKFADVNSCRAALALGLRGRRGVLHEVLDDGERRDGEDLFFVHEAHGLIRELKGVIDGGDS